MRQSRLQLCRDGGDGWLGKALQAWELAGPPSIKITKVVNGITLNDPVTWRHGGVPRLSPPPYRQPLSRQAPHPMTSF